MGRISSNSRSVPLQIYDWFKVKKLQLTRFVVDAPVPNAAFQPRQDNLVQCGRNSEMYYDSGKLLGEGSFNTCVFLGKFHRSLAAIKRIVVKDDDRDTLDKEIENLCKIHHHENVVRYFGHAKIIGPHGSNFIFIALELCDLTLSKFVAGGNHDESAIREILVQTCKGVSHLHSIKIVHRDLNPNNILIKTITQNEIRVKISDFGISRQVPEDRSHLMLKTNSGTLGWTAPEIFNSGIVALTTRADIFSLGCVLYYVISNGSHLFGGDVLLRQVNIKTNAKHWDQIRLLPSFNEMVPLIDLMTRPNPNQRPTANAALNHHSFWNSQKKLSFLQNLSDCLETEDPSTSLTYCKGQFDHFSLELFCGRETWNECLCEALSTRAMETVGKGKRLRYNHESAISLLRFIRNLSHHLATQPEDVKKALKSLPDEFLSYFLSRFPYLVEAAYECFYAAAKEYKDILGSYYKSPNIFD